MSRSRDDTRVVGRRRESRLVGASQRVPSKRFRPPPSEGLDGAAARDELPRPDPDATPTVPPPAKTPVSLPRLAGRGPEAPRGLERWRLAIEERVLAWPPAVRAVTAAVAFLALTALSYALAR